MGGEEEWNAQEHPTGFILLNARTVQKQKLIRHNILQIYSAFVGHLGKLR